MCFLEFILIWFYFYFHFYTRLAYRNKNLTETKPEAVFCFVPTWRFWIYFCRPHISLWTHLRVFDSVSVCSQVNLSVVRHVSGVESASVVWLRQEQWSPTVSSVAVVSLASSQWRKTWHLSESVWLPPRPPPPPPPRPPACSSSHMLLALSGFQFSPLLFSLHSAVAYCFKVKVIFWSRSLVFTVKCYCTTASVLLVLLV